MTRTTRESCEARDLDDPLASFRDQFKLTEGLIYLDGHSLGAMPGAAAARAREVVEQRWAVDLIASWNNAGWFEAPKMMGDKIARLIGAGEGEVVVTDSTGINLYKVLHAALNLRPERSKILMEGSNFPTDNYIAQGLVAQGGGRHELIFVEEENLLSALNKDVAVLCLTQVHYKSGRILDMASITSSAQARGITVIWDLCHSAGAIPVDLNGCNADFAVGCTYKYLNGGPGSPAYVYSAHRHHDVVRQPLTGWWGHAAPFDFQRDYEPAEGISQMLSGTQPILSLMVAEIGIDMFLQADMGDIRRKSMALGDLFIQMMEQRCGGCGFDLASPRDAARRGSHVSFTHEQGYAICRAMISGGTVGDFRAPTTMRFGFAPLYVRYVDVWDAVDRLSKIMKTDRWRDPQFNRHGTVT
jgi:kynureninase